MYIRSGEGRRKIAIRERGPHNFSVAEFWLGGKIDLGVSVDIPTFSRR